MGTLTFFSMKQMEDMRLALSCGIFINYLRIVTMHIKNRNLSKIKIFDNREMKFQMTITSQWVIRLL